MAITTRHSLSNCVNCGKSVDSATSAYGDYKPRKGDLTICYQCGEIMEFDGDIIPIPLTDKTNLEIDRETRNNLYALQLKIKERNR